LCQKCTILVQLQEKETMKTSKKITLIFLLVALLGCSKDDNSSSERSFAELSGTWKITSYSYEGTTSYRSINSNEAWNTSYYGEGWLLSLIFVFSENPNEYSITGNHNIDHYFTDENGEEFFYYANLVRNETGTYVRNSNTNITFNDDGVYKHSIIQELSDTTLKFNMSYSSSETNSENILITRLRNESYIMERIN